MEYFSKISIHVGPGKQEAAEYITSVTEDLIKEDWNSTQSNLKKYMPESKPSDSDFLTRAAGYLGRVASEKHCHIFKWVKVETDFEPLKDIPENLGDPVRLDSDHSKGLKIWLVKSNIHKLTPLV